MTMLTPETGARVPEAGVLHHMEAGTVFRALDNKLITPLAFLAAF